MILIADSGSTKTDWCFKSSKEDYRIVNTKGINPFYQNKEEISHTIEELLNMCPSPEKIYFYGAGCTKEKSSIIYDIFSTLVPSCKTIEVDSDLLGAAKAACGLKAGIAAILGTGSNSCEYDGNSIVKSIPPLGFILGDEGSGAVLGKKFVADGMKSILSKDIFDKFLDEYGLSVSVIMDKVYREPFPNRFLASLCPFLNKNRDNEEIHNLLVNSFRGFFNRNIKKYNYSEYDVNFVGSIGYHFKDEVKEAAEIESIKTGSFIKSPMEGLIDFCS